MSSLASYCKKLDGSGETESLESVPTAPSLSLKLPQLLLDHIMRKLDILVKIITLIDTNH